MDKAENSLALKRFLIAKSLHYLCESCLNLPLDVDCLLRAETGYMFKSPSSNTPNSEQNMIDDCISFVRKKDYRFLRELGQGACGKTVLLYDEVVDEHFVCKKYVPFFEDQRSDLFPKFIQEIKLLYRMSHRNIVRVFSYHLYPEKQTGYIVMEYIDGSEIDDYLASHPEEIEDIFTQAIEGFSYLEENGILHRDIRTQNLMVTRDGIVKIIDFGFGKKIKNHKDFEKSIDLNWQYTVPADFIDSKYDFQTEIYFIGKLFQKISDRYELGSSKYREIIEKMCSERRENRPASFSDLRKDMQSGSMDYAEFSEDEVVYYRIFSNQLSQSILKIECNSKYYNDAEKIIQQLNGIYRSCMLESTIPDSLPILETFINGGLHFLSEKFEVHALKNFLSVFKACSPDKRNIMLSNIHTKLNAKPQYDFESEQEIPF